VRWHEVAETIAWTPPTSTEIGVVVKSGIAAGLAWWAAELVTEVPHPILAPLTAIVVVQVSVRASVLAALQRSAAVVLGVLLAVAIGDALSLGPLTIALVVASLLALAELVLRLPRAAARQVPISALVVLSALSASPETAAWWRALDTVVGAAVGVVVSLVLPASRLVDARQTLQRLGSGVSEILRSIGAGLHEPWSVDHTAQWQRAARTARDRLVRQATEAVGNSREVARWNIRDRRHVEELARYEKVVTQLERIAVGTEVIARGVDDQAQLTEVAHPPMVGMGELVGALAVAVDALVGEVLGTLPSGELTDALQQVGNCRLRCITAASRRARLALESPADVGRPDGEWLLYAALLVQVDRIVEDLRGLLPS
jgi:uncharacterized membrane protein YgaE (UPF0421/DUF939 family)